MIKKSKLPSSQAQSPSIRREQKKKALFRMLSSLIQTIACDDAALNSLFVSRVELSDDGSMCYIYFSTYTTQEAFETMLPKLILYKPSMRAALAKEFQSRYTPDLIFYYDKIKDKERAIHELLDQVKTGNTGTDRNS